MSLQDGTAAAPGTAETQQSGENAANEEDEALEGLCLNQRTTTYTYAH